MEEDAGPESLDLLELLVSGRVTICKNIYQHSIDEIYTSSTFLLTI